MFAPGICLNLDLKAVAIDKAPSLGACCRLILFLGGGWQILHTYWSMRSGIILFPHDALQGTNESFDRSNGGARGHRGYALRAY